MAGASTFSPAGLRHSRFRPGLTAPRLPSPLPTPPLPPALQALSPLGVGLPVGLGVRREPLRVLRASRGPEATTDLYKLTLGRSAEGQRRPTGSVISLVFVVVSAHYRLSLLMWPSGAVAVFSPKPFPREHLAGCSQGAGPAWGGGPGQPMVSLAPHVYGDGVLRVRHAGDAGQRAREALPRVPGPRVSACRGGPWLPPPVGSPTLGPVPRSDEFF